MYSLHFSLIFLIFTTVFVFAGCDGNFTEVLEANCTEEENSSMKDLTKMAVCQLRETLVVLEPKLGQMFEPSAVFVERCIGHYTDPAVICEPINETFIQFKQIPVNVITWTNNLWNNRCRLVNVEEHISIGNASCWKACRIKKNDCKSGQHYNESLCKCECADESQKTECNNGKTWNKEKCQCICKKQEECSTNFTWNDEICNCTAEAQLFTPHFTVNQI